MAHITEILEDTSRKLAAEKIRHGFIMSGYAGDLRLPVQVVSVQTAVRRIKNLPPPDLLIIDEAHLSVADTYKKVINGLGNPLLLLLTATPERLDGRGLGEIADTIIPTCSTQDLIDEGLLAPIRYYAPSTVDLSGVRTVAGDYAKNDLNAVVDKPKIIGDAVSHWKKIAAGRPTIAFCCSIEHANHVAEQYRQAGIRSVAVSGDSDKADRRKALDDLRNGRVDVVTNCALWVAGVDAPNVSCISLMSPSKSLTKYLQSVGRGLRTHQGKTDCIILDHAGMVQTHGLPTDIREWSLEGKDKKSRPRDPDEIGIRQCPRCFAVVRAAVSQCRCGHVFVPKARVIEQEEGTLQEVDIEAMRRQSRREQGSAQTLDELIALGSRRGFKNPVGWAKHVYSARQRG
jgi:superfamily II DNA or RNA helicase